MSRARVFMGDPIVRKTDRTVNKGRRGGHGTKIEVITEVGKNHVCGQGGSILIHIGTYKPEGGKLS